MTVMSALAIFMSVAQYKFSRFCASCPKYEKMHQFWSPFAISGPEL